MDKVITSPTHTIPFPLTGERDGKRIRCDALRAIKPSIGQAAAPCIS